MSNQPLAGFSLGWVFDTTPASTTLNEVLEFTLCLGSDAVEFCFSKERLKHFCLMRNRELKMAVKGFDYVSFHLPAVRWTLDNMETREVLEQAIVLCQEFDPQAFVVHPDTIENWDWFANVVKTQLLPMAIEFPMDGDRATGVDLQDLYRIRERFSDFMFVLDVQHAYEHDPSGRLALSSAEAMGNRLCHLHVSGQQKRQDGLHRHSYLHEADNKEAITQILGASCLANVPRISEGEFKTCISSAVKAELEAITMRQ